MTRDHRYPEGTVRAVLDSDFVTTPTAAALQARLGPVPPFDPVLDAHATALLKGACDRLLPQLDRVAPIDVARTVHRNLATGPGDGWRYAALPGDVQAFVTGLAAIDECARTMTGNGFLATDDQTRDAVLLAVQRGPQARWFEDLLAAATEAYYAHPLAQEEIGYLGMADARGWDTIGLAARAPHEPVELSE